MLVFTVSQVYTYDSCKILHRWSQPDMQYTCIAGKVQPLQDITHEAEAAHSSYPPEQAPQQVTAPGNLTSIALLGDPDVDVTAAADSIALHALKLLRDPT